MKASQRARFADETLVDQIIELDGQQRKGKWKTLSWSVSDLRWDPIADRLLTSSVASAKYALDNMRKEKGDISKAVAAKKKADKKADISAEQA